MTINNPNNNLFFGKDFMLDVYCPHCNSHQTLCASKLSDDNIYPNSDLNVPGAISGFMECAVCHKGIGFDMYPPYTKNRFGIALEVYKKNVK